MSAILLFGKMPSHGDFVARGLSRKERYVLDEWLSREMADARALLGDGFEPLFDTAPAWRFAWGDTSWTAGAMANSIDKVGRRYPLLVARRDVAASEVKAAAETCERAIYDAFEQGWHTDELASALAADLPPSAHGEADGEGQPSGGWWTLGSEKFVATFIAGKRPSGLMFAILGRSARAAA